jgi:plasmid stabilization system protein ParE
LSGIRDWIAASSALAAYDCLEHITADMETLAVFPRRCPVALEAHELGRDLRQMISGDYRIVFSIDVDAQVVKVHFVRHAARLPGTTDSS